MSHLRHFSHIMNRYLSDKPIPTTTTPTTIPPFARKPFFAIAIAAIAAMALTKNQELKTNNPSGGETPLSPSPSPPPPPLFPSLCTRRARGGVDSQIAQNPCAECEEIAEICESSPCHLVTGSYSASIAAAGQFRIVAIQCRPPQRFARFKKPLCESFP